MKPFHLCSLEIVKTIRRVLGGGGVLLNNSTQPRISVAGVAKRSLAVGETIERGAGGFQLRGEAVLISEHPSHVPIGVVNNAIVRRRIEPGQIIGGDNVEIPDCSALRIAIRQLQAARATPSPSGRNAIPNES